VDVLQRMLRHLDQSRATIRDMLAGALPIDTPIPEPPPELVAELEQGLSEDESN
jgi:hypothetical protein